MSWFKKATIRVRIPVIIFTRNLRIITRRDSRFCGIVIYKGHAAIGVGCGCFYKCHRLDDVESLVTAVLKICFCLGTVQFLKQMPCGISQPEERPAVFVLEKPAVLRYDQAAVVPWRLTFCALYTGTVNRKQDG